MAVFAPHLQSLTTELDPLRQQLTRHPMYARLNNLSALRCFMEAHVFAVWDFMSLIKTLQQRLTCVTVPWRPPVDRDSARIINEIVLVEESDETPDARRGSHFEFYLEAMKEIGADTRAITTFLRILDAGESAASALDAAAAHPNTRAFVLETLATCTLGTHEVTASFLLGREALIPAMFEQLVQVTQPLNAPMLAWYLTRHITIDGQEHGPAGYRLLARLCGDDRERWQSATACARRALHARGRLWDGVLAAIEAQA
jgi:hypothetical protein